MFEAEDHQEIREAVRKLCAQFPGEYWRKLDAERAYPAEFVKALTEAGYLATLIPEEYGGAGLTLSAAAAVLEEIQRAGWRRRMERLEPVPAASGPDLPGAASAGT